MKFVLVCLSLILLSHNAFCQLTTVTGKITNKGLPVSGCTITVKGTSKSTVTDQNGNFSIQVAAGENILVLSNTGFTATEIQLNNKSAISFDLSSLGGGGVSSLKSYWVGAKIGYNFTDNTGDNFFVGSASIALNLLTIADSAHHTFGIVGNIGNFKFNRDSIENKNIQKLGQSINGLSVGLGYTHQTYLGDIQSFRKFALLGARLTTFKNVGPDSQTINLNQFISTVGLEYELQGFKNGGGLTVSTGLTLALFDKGLYQKLFTESKSSLLTFDASAILPISKLMGFFVNGSFSRRASPIYIIGIIFKS